MKGDFLWAVAQMKEGKKVRRTSWDKGHYWICKDYNVGIITNSVECNANFTIQNTEATDWEIIDEKSIEEKKTLSDKIIDMTCTSLEFPDDGRRKIELSSNSELLCKRQKEMRRAYRLDFIDVEDVKEKLKEFIRRIKDISGIRTLEDSDVDENAKEIFGSRLIE